MKQFECTPDCEAAFQNIKQYLQSPPPILVPPWSGETLHLYVSKSLFVISVVLCTKCQIVFHLVYYVSHVLQAVETRYSSLEKHIFALIIVARKLWHYFQTHPVIMHTKAPIYKSLYKSNVAGCIMRWPIELYEYDIEYTPQKMHKC